MAFPPAKPGLKQWAGGGAPPAPPPGHPAPPPAGAPGAPPPGGAAAGGVNPQMVQRAMKAITQMLQDGGLPQPAMDCLTQCNQHLQTAGAPPGAAPPGAPPAPGGAPPSPHPAGPPPAQ